MYPQEKMDTALKVYHQSGSIRATVRLLGYPAQRTLYDWITQERKRKPPRRRNIWKRLHHPPVELRLEALHRCYNLGESVQSVSEDIGYTQASIRRWRRKYLQGGAVSLARKKDLNSNHPQKGIESTASDMQKLQEQIRDLQMQVDILKGILDIVKKDPGVDLTALKNREKAVLVDALKSKYSLPSLLKALSLPKSSYYYRVSAMKRPDKYEKLRDIIRSLFQENRQCYGYRRIYAILKQIGSKVSEKIVRRIMREEGLTVQIRRRRKYSSYLGEISPAVPDKLGRNFHAEGPNQILLADLTEFVIPTGRVFLSALIDCFDGMVTAWTIGTSPNAKLVNTMLKQAISKLKEGEHPIIHTDRGCHYRWAEWINLMKEFGLERSMSRKACTADNAACEGFFGRIKNEMFYCRSWNGVTVSEFMIYLNEYLTWYNKERIKQSLGYLSPWEYRMSLGLIH